MDFDLLDQFLLQDNWLELPTCTPIPTPFSPLLSHGNNIKSRIIQALNFIKDAQIQTNFLVQLWVPVQKGDQLVLTTGDQPFSLHENCEKLEHYRKVSTVYEFSAEVNSNQSLGLPGRVFVGKSPEWTPDVSFFSSYEYPRINHAHICDVHGSIALPVFERNSGICLGVVEVIMTMQKTSFAPELVVICSALQAVDLRSSEVSTVPRVSLNINSYQTALPEILHVLTTACTTHNLPLAQTWVPCTQQGKRGTRHTDENFPHCISTVDSACYINDPSMAAFHLACSEHHLWRGQGMVGRAFITNEPCFCNNISGFSKLDYPLSHHAKLFNLKGVVAIRLRCMNTGLADFVLEFFLPVNCVEFEEQRILLDSLSNTMQNSCKMLRVVTDKEIEMESSLELRELNGLIEPEITGQSNEVLNGDNRDLSDEMMMDGCEKRRSKMEKSISLPVLRQYFAGSLKDAAKSLGVCPTTLKRICRQHGINRWPSRKIKKVDHSLKKLQLIIDSVHGADSAIQLSSIYTNPSKTHISQHNSPENGINNLPKNQHDKSSSSGSHNSNSNSNSNPSLGAETNLILAQKSNGIIKRKNSHKNLNGVVQKEINHAQMKCQKELEKKIDGWTRLKVMYESENVRLRLNPNWGLKNLKEEICKRFNIKNGDLVNLRYLDDDSEWILLTCDADLMECIHVHKSLKADTIKICAQNNTSIKS
ncbi:hypothetical protein LUZ60_011970 [Juncus effusus]|nr:hypothetical protein LUZ60_011970 [Juncus effusus]